ncbi:AAA family ATPase [Streptomyces mirabilis]|uniref:AAA family ATPase n=1 Tax=Streptomyces mirabilis TaxID=68239 RepID=UPI00367AE643
MRQGDAVIIGVSTFRGDVPEGEEVPVGTAVWPALEFVKPLVPRVRDAFSRLGYRVRCRIDPVQEELRDALGHAGGDAVGGHRIVHVISHGRADLGRMRLDMVPADGRVGRDTDVAGWISDSDAEGRLSLFLVDLCGSGVAARLPSSVYEAGRQTYAWVITASDGQEEAYDGRFSAAVADVLDELTRTGLGTDPSQEFVDFHLVARHIGMQLEAAGGRVQTVRATLMDPSAPKPELPFFPNPAHPAFAADPVRTRRTALDPPVRDFLEELDPVDVRHFTDKPGRHFTGRRSQLRLLAPWLDDPDAPRLCVVTGSPGRGKSALLGALMCAAHPQLAEQAVHIRERLPGACRPAFHEELAAVQARQRSLTAVLSALARQLDLPLPGGEWTSEAFMDALRAMSEAPVLVVDALDEAVNPGDVTEGLLLPLTGACRADGRPLCRVLLGMRPWEQFHQLKARAETTGLLIDLDHSPTDELEEDLAAYLDDVLTHIDGYRAGPARRIREHLTRTAAARLARTPQQGEKWGEFLVASIFTSYLASAPTAGDIPSAHNLGDSVPVTLPDVLELDLSARSTPATARALLVAIAHAKGNGIPAELAYPLARALRPTADPSCFPQILDESMFYLRTHVDTDGTTLYRPFHQGLADHLRTHPYHYNIPDQDPAPSTPHIRIPAAQLVLDTLLTPRTHADRIVWANASPYLLRHAIQHAADANNADALISDPEFLTHADPHTLAAALNRADSKAAVLSAAVYLASVQHHRNALPDSRRSLLAVDAARYGAVSLHSHFIKRMPKPSWQPRWATGGTLNSALLNTFTGHTGKVRSVACTTVSEQSVVVTASDDRVLRMWDLTTGTPVGEPLTGHTGAVTAIACTSLHGHPVAVTASDDRVLRMWDLTTGTPVGNQLGRRAGPTTAVACTVLDGRPVAVIAGDVDTLRIWDIATGMPIGPPLTSNAGFITALACTTLNGYPIAVTASDDQTLETWDVATGRPIGQPLPVHTDASTAVACTVLENRPVAVTTSDDRTVRIWDLTRKRLVGRPTIGHTGLVRAVACTSVEGRPVAVSASDDRTVRIWDLTTGRPLCGPCIGHTGAVTAIACTSLHGHPVAVTASDDRTVRIWDLTTGTPIGEPLTGHTGAVTAIACTSLHGHPVAVTASDDFSALIWHLATRQPAGELITVPTGWAETVACTILDGRPVAVLGCTDLKVRVCDLLRRQPLFRPLAGHSGRVGTVACSSAGGQSVAVTGSADGTARIWNLTTGWPLSEPLIGHTGAVTAVAYTTVDNHPVVVTASKDMTVRFWNLCHTSSEVVPVTLSEVVPVTLPVSAVAVAPDGSLVIGMGGEVMVLDSGRRTR